jgi:hypothetical protein
MATWDRLASTWQTMKPRVIFLAIGLIAGPFVTNSIGWQVTSGAAKAELRDGLVEQSASICAERAHAAVKDTSKLDWTARTDLAEKWGIMPGATSTDSDVKFACARKLEA